jgi:hypothetical protein
MPPPDPHMDGGMGPPFSKFRQWLFLRAPLRSRLPAFAVANEPSDHLATAACGHARVAIGTAKYVAVHCATGATGSDKQRYKNPHVSKRPGKQAQSYCKYCDKASAATKLEKSGYAAKIIFGKGRPE